jgi:hypothetical protein
MSAYGVGVRPNGPVSRNQLNITARLLTGWPVFDFRLRPSLTYVTAFILCLGPICTSIQRITGTKRPVREGESSSPSSSDVTNAWSYSYTPRIRLRIAVLKWANYNFPVFDFRPLYFSSLPFTVVKIAAIWICSWRWRSSGIQRRVVWE